MATSTLGSGTLVLAGTTSGTTTVTATAVAGTTTLTLPAATDTLVGKATTDTLTNKTLTSPTITGTLTTTGNTILGDASTDTLNVGNGDLVKDASGNLLVGTTSQLSAGKTSIQFDGATLNGTVLKTTYATTGSNFLLFLNSAGSVAGVVTQNGTTTVSYTTSSDYRLKDNVQPMTGALAKVAQLKPVTYKWKSDNVNGQGFLAHELQAVVPDCVVGEKDAVYADGSPKYQGIDTSFLVATLTAAIQEQQALIQTLTARITALESA